MKRAHLTFLTWLRGLAALLVVVDHSIRIAVTRYFPDDPMNSLAALQFIDIGTFGVDLFFALSGCTLFISYADRLQGARDTGRFYIARVFRVWPAFAFSLGVYLVFIEIFKALYAGDKSFWIAQFLNQYSLVNILQYLSLTFNLTGPRDLFIGPYWSLPVEFQYYLLLPLALFAMRFARRSRLDFLVPLIFGGALYLFYRYHFVVVDRYEVFKMGFTFFGGVLLAMASRSCGYRLPFWLSVAGVAFMFIVAGCVRAGAIQIPAWWYFVSDQENIFGILGLGAVMFALFSMPPKVDTPLARLLNRYGEVSYSVYLFHMLFVGIAALIIMKLHMHESAWKFLFALPFTVVMSYLVALGSYKYIEMPFIELGRRLVAPRK